MGHGHLSLLRLAVEVPLYPSTDLEQGGDVQVCLLCSLGSKYPDHFWGLAHLPGCYHKVSFLQIDLLCPLEVYHRAHLHTEVALRVIFEMFDSHGSPCANSQQLP